MSTQAGGSWFNATKGALGLFGPTNKARQGFEEGDEETVTPQFESTMSDEELKKLTAMWKDEHEAYMMAKNIETQQKDNLNYWIGRQFNELQTSGTRKPLVDNQIFEALETALPIMTRANPEANVTSDGTPEGEAIAQAVQEVLKLQADRLRLRLLLKGGARNWALFLLGALKYEWKPDIKDFNISIVLTTRFIFDPKAWIDEGGYYHGQFLGEKKRAAASRLIKLFPKKKQYIEQICEGATGTKLTYVEWWIDSGEGLDVVFMLNDEVLGKFKNPHWNYDVTETAENTDEEDDSEEIETVVHKGRNHFKKQEYPYTFISIFSLQRQPHDETSLITQIIPIQDVVNKRYQQIDRNTDQMNNAIVLSGKYFTKEQAAEASSQLAKGNPLWVPEGDIRASYTRDPVPPLASDVFRQLDDARDEIRNVFGTAGSSAQGLEQQKSVRGKILVNQMDASRIGGTITDKLEQVADTAYNWMVQMMMVYYDEEHSFNALGEVQGSKLIKLKNTDFFVPLNITVKEGSLIPKDPLTQRNEAMDLWAAQGIDPVTFYKRLGFPNPQDTAQQLILWKLVEQGKIPPQMYLPSMAQAMQQMQQQAQPVPPGTQTVSATEDNRSGGGPPSPDMSQQLLHSVPVH